MSEMLIGAIGFVILFVLILLGLPIGICMGLVGVVGVIYFAGINAGLSLLDTIPFTSLSSYTLAALPLFILMGTLCHYGGVSEDLYYSVNQLIGHKPGGLAMASVGACAGFAAVSASSLATVATMGKVALPEMRKYKYSDTLATGAIAAGGSMGILIPPSGILIIYGIIVEQSIGRLFIAGIIPGILEALFYMVTIYLICKINPLLGPAGPRTTLRQKMKSLQKLWSVLLLFLLILGGIYFGIFSPTEAAGIGACGAFLIVLVKRRYSWQVFTSSLIEVATVITMVVVLLIGAQMFVSFMVMSKLPLELAALVISLDVSPYIIIAGIMVLYLILGCVISAMALLMLTVPVIAPIIVALDFNLIWFGIIVVRAIEIAAITPPVGLNVYVMKSVAPDIPMSTIFRGIIPFFISDLFHVALLISFPVITLFLPTLMKG